MRIKSDTLGGSSRPSHPFRLHHISRLPKTGCIDQCHAQAAEINRLGHEITGRARNLGHDRARRTDERVEQTRLSDVWTPDDRNLQSFAHQTSAPAVVQERSRSLDDAVDRFRERGGSTK